MPGVHEFFGRAPRLEKAMLLKRVSSKPRSCLRSLTVFVPLAHTDRYEVRRAHVTKKTKVNTVDTAISVLDWTRRMLGTRTRLEEVVFLMNANSVVDDEGVRAVWTRLLMPNVVVRVQGEFSEATRAWVGNAKVEPAEGREVLYEL
ncbi:hypothetical protein ARMGADRAFT_1082140 [Armillaria gallica]|uniref:Uncharacterized protein n=1 Tax=Armillaria gallica TaxID=47427 RepID=A0A2H3DP93_ARMGA|nr:hypothetical protein ARMGADRAFT_1082140 [Armillaria gallica]